MKQNTTETHTCTHSATLSLSLPYSHELENTQSTHRVLTAVQVCPLAERRGTKDGEKERERDVCDEMLMRAVVSQGERGGCSEEAR